MILFITLVYHAVSLSTNRLFKYFMAEVPII